MYLYWYKRKKGVNNFGDELNPYIIGKLTGLKIHHLPIADTKLRRTLKSIIRFFRNQLSIYDVIKVVISLKEKKYFVAVGSVIEWIGGRNCHVWGAGLIRRNGKIKNANFHAVRGEITKSRLVKLGYPPPKTIGDPAILVPIIFTPMGVKKYKLGIIPHYVHKDELLKLIESKSDSILIIDVLNTPEVVIEQINLCQKTISSSLHGIIISQAYKIPSLWVNLGGTPLAGDDIKFEDYFSSVHIKPYKKLEIDIKKDLVEQSKLLFTSYKRYSLINIDIKKMQKALILNAPFKILTQYKRKLGIQ